MLRTRLAGLAVLLLLVAGCTTLQVDHDYNPKTDFSLLKTYGWLNAMDHPSDNVRINNELVRDSVRTAVEETLGAKGFVKAEGEQADFLIAWFGAIERKLKAQTINHYYAPYGYGTLYRDPYWNSQAAANIKEFEEGSLVFDFLDPKSQALIWRGSGKGKITAGLPEEKVKKNLKIAVQQILADFPPR